MPTDTVSALIKRLPPNTYIQFVGLPVCQYTAIHVENNGVLSGLKRFVVIVRSNIWLHTVATVVAMVGCTCGSLVLSGCNTDVQYMVGLWQPLRHYPSTGITSHLQFSHLQNLCTCTVTPQFLKLYKCFSFQLCDACVVPYWPCVAKRPLARMEPPSVSQHLYPWSAGLQQPALKHGGYF